MKTYLIALLLLVTAVASSSAETLVAPLTRPKQQRHRPAPPISQKREVDGVVPRAIRGGNPLQMFNPKAPAKYGTSQDAVSYDPSDPIRWRGIKLFEFRF